MVKNKKQMFIIISIFAIVLFLGGVTYAWYSYRGETDELEIVAGDIYLTHNEGSGQIDLSNAFPESAEEARLEDSNYMTFNITGLNTSNKTMYYEFILNYGDEKDEPKSRYYDKDLRFDLVEIDENGNEIDYILSNEGYDTIVNKRIWVDTIAPNTSTNVVRRYKLRVWLSEDVIISDTAENRHYTTTEYPNKYATVKLTVSGDFQEKEAYRNMEYLLTKSITAKEADTNVSCSNITYVEDGITYLSGNSDCVDMNYVWYSGKLWRVTSIYPDGAMKLVTQNNITSLAFNEPDSPNFYIDDNTKSYAYSWLNEDFYDTLYNANQFLDTGKKWNATRPANTDFTNKPLETNMVTANVGLLNSYDYYNSYRCIDITDDDTCPGTDSASSYLNINAYNWLLNPYNSTTVWIPGSNGNLGHHYTQTARGIRPSIVIKSGVKVTGNGTVNSPYRLDGDKEVGVANELVNTRLSGEYVKLKNGNSEQVFRIVGVEDSKTKIVSMTYANNKATHLFATGSLDDDTLWGSGTTTGADTWYTYLNDTSTGYLKTLKDTYGNIFDSGMYYYGVSGYNYKLMVCATASNVTTKACEKTSDKDTFDIGLLRYGEMFATSQKYNNISNTTMWLIGRYDSSRVWNVDSNCTGSYSSPDTAYAARPTVHLKSTVKIISGRGTESDPYVVR